MAGIELDYLGFDPIVPGMTFGSLPINDTLNRYIILNPIPLPLSLGDTYMVYPRANYAIYSASFDIKWFIPGSNFFLDFTFSSVSFSATISGDLKNETTGGISPSAISGTAKFTQVIPGLMLGHQWQIGSKFFIESAFGGGIPITPSYSLNLSGSATSAIAVAPDGPEKFESAKASIQAAYDDAVNKYRSTVKFLPFAYFNIGFTF